ncbi:MAG: GNAT family N-acetyltransferase [Rheinheimera sp.]
MSTTAIQHHPELQCFILEWQGQQARLDYQLRVATASSSASVDFNHTFVPPEFRGRGLAQQLVEFGLQWAAEQHLQVSASCWYVDKVMRAKGD